MSHSPQRIEKDCLNCGAIVQGHYCQNCGQENIEPRETFWDMVTHFFYDITHFDGSFFVTLKDLLFKPGFLTKEYMKGRRKTYLHPVRMYVFTSAVFFLVFFSLFGVKSPPVVNSANPDQIEAFEQIKKEALRNAKTKKDSLRIEEASGIFQMNKAPEAPDPDSLDREGKYNAGGFKVSFGKSVEEYKSVAEYDSVQETLSAKERDNWFIRLITRRSVSINEKYKNNQAMIATKLVDKFIHSFPYLLFVSLPLYALFLKLLYVRRKQFYFADHGVFLIHLYIFTFLLMLVYFLLDELNALMNWSGINIIQVLLLLAGIFYTLKAMGNFYGQAWGKTILKFILFNVMCIITAIFLFVVFLFLSLYQV